MDAIVILYAVYVAIAMAGISPILIGFFNITINVMGRMSDRFKTINITELMINILCL